MHGRLAQHGIAPDGFLFDEAAIAIAAAQRFARLHATTRGSGGRMTSGRQAFSGRAAITGVGMTALSRYSGVGVARLALAATRDAISDAGLEIGDVDAVLTYHMSDSVGVNELSRQLGLRDSIWTNEIYGGGTQSASILGDAAMLVHAGIAANVLVYRALNGRSGKRMGQTGIKVGSGREEEFTVPYGMVGPVHLFALVARRWMHETGATQNDLASVVTSSRARATSNPRALQRAGLTTAEYDASPWVATPLHRVDCCLETDGAAALVVSRADVASRVRPASPLIHAVVRGGGPGANAIDKAASVGTLFSHYVAPMIWSASGMGAADIDIALLYDAYSFVVLEQLEDFGFCTRGGSGEFIRSGATDVAGELPVNPHGGMLSEGYVHGLNNIVEAVRQLRGQAPTNQVGDAAVALCTGFGGSHGSAAVLVRR